MADELSTLVNVIVVAIWIIVGLIFIGLGWKYWLLRIFDDEVERKSSAKH